MTPDRTRPEVRRDAHDRDTVTGDLDVKLDKGGPQAEDLLHGAQGVLPPPESRCVVGPGQDVLTHPVASTAARQGPVSMATPLRNSNQALR